MSGGIAYVFDEDGTFHDRCNLETVALEDLEEEEIGEVEEMIRRHADYTKSERAWRILAWWEEMAPKFVKVMPKDYRRMLEAIRRAEKEGLMGEQAVMMAFEENKNDLARVSGN
jgi:glutamate synthase (ferredoxin)